jgi:hypothetical protein
MHRCSGVGGGAAATVWTGATVARSSSNAVIGLRMALSFGSNAALDGESSLDLSRRDAVTEG